MPQRSRQLTMAGPPECPERHDRRDRPECSDRTRRIDRTRRALLGAGAALACSFWPSLARRVEARARVAEGRSRLILLGTAGGPTPKAQRSAPAQAIVVDDVVYVIDCGNGVARQMVRAGLDLGAIRHVFLTHQHSDHNADYGNLLLLAWAANLKQPVDTWGPPPLRRMTRLFLEMNDADIRTRQRDEGRPPLDTLVRAHEIARAGEVMRDPRVRVRAVLVDHPPVVPSFAFRFDCPDRSIVISGDTRPSPALIELARDADVLVHEVMHLPALDRLIASEPNAPRLRQHLLDSHTTSAQAGRVAREAGVKTLVLSHFVPGGDTSLTDELWQSAAAVEFSGRIIVGRDLLEI